MPNTDTCWHFLPKRTFEPTKSVVHFYIKLTQLNEKTAPLCSSVLSDLYPLHWLLSNTWNNINFRNTEQGPSLKFFQKHRRSQKNVFGGISTASHLAVQETQTNKKIMWKNIYTLLTKQEKNQVCKPQSSLLTQLYVLWSCTCSVTSPQLIQKTKVAIF